MERLFIAKKHSDSEGLGSHDLTEVEEIYQFETMLSNLSTQFVELPADQIDRKIEEGLKFIAEVLRIDRCSVAQLNRERTELRITHVFAAEGVNPLLGVILNEQQPWYTKQLLDFKTIVMADITELPEEAFNEKAHCRQQGIRSMALIPLVVGDTFLGVVGFAALTSTRQWPQKLVQRLKMVASVFANAIMRKRSNALIDELLRFETMLSDLSARFVEISADNIDREITKGLKLIAEVLRIDNCTVAQINQEKSELGVSHSYAGVGVRVMSDAIISQQKSWVYQSLMRGKTMVFSSIEEFPVEAMKEKERCRTLGIQSIALIPLVVSDQFLGLVSFSAINSGRQWPDQLVQRLTSVGSVFANALMRKRSEQKLRTALTEIKDLKDKIEAENTYLRQEIRLQHEHKDFIGQSEPIRYVLNRAEQVAGTDSSVLILGETGTGKELLAQTIHNLSNRVRQPMILVNCAALPSNLMESELFGHEKGAFTGAQSRRIGRFELADRSTIFLDEIGELSLEMQAKLLRVLQQNHFARLGGNDIITTDVRVIAATNRDLLQLVNLGEFRMDLYYRLNVFPIVLPPLRNRQEDIPELVHFFIKEFSEKLGKQVTSISQSSMRKLQKCHWPGNIRELKNIIERAMIISPGHILEVELPESGAVAKTNGVTLEEVQKNHILEILKLTNWRIRGNNGAAETLGLKPTTLEARMSRLGIKRAKKR